MKMINAFARVLILAASLAASVAHADFLFDTTGAVSLSDPTQLGRLSRNSVPQDWAGSELLPGVINTTTTYHYTTYFINVGLTPFIQIDFDSLLGNTFVMAYQTSYNPLSKGTNWLGDEGFSGNAFGTDPNFFNVIADLNSVLCIVVANTGANGLGTGDPFHLIVEGYLDANFTSTVPEPSTLLLCFLPLMALVGRETWLRRRS
jgi:hypothetical protein